MRVDHNIYPRSERSASWRRVEGSRAVLAQLVERRFRKA